VLVRRLGRSALELGGLGGVLEVSLRVQQWCKLQDDRLERCFGQQRRIDDVGAARVRSACARLQLAARAAVDCLTAVDCPRCGGLQPGGVLGCAAATVRKASESYQERGAQMKEGLQRTWEQSIGC
jgi:hypothetical protein